MELEHKRNLTLGTKRCFPPVSPVFGSKPVQIRSPPKAVIPFGGPVSLVEFFNQIGLAPKPTETMPFALYSPNAIPPLPIR